jgi:hypothetical protein
MVVMPRFYYSPAACCGAMLGNVGEKSRLGLRGDRCGRLSGDVKFLASGGYGELS